MTQRTFGGITQSQFRVFNTQRIRHRIGDAVLNVQFYVDDVFVFGQHAFTDFSFTNTGRVNDDYVFNHWQFPVQTFTFDAVKLTST